MHTLVFSLVLLAVVMLATAGRRPARQLLLGLPIGTLLHLVFDGAWADTDLFWWPLGGWGFDDAALPEVGAGLVEPRARARRCRPSWCGCGGRRGCPTRPAGASSCTTVVCSPERV